MFSKSISLLVLLSIVFGFGAGAVSASPICGGEVSYQLIAGQTIDVGSIIVSNDSNNLYVKYVTDSPWELREAQLFVGSSPFTERLPPGQAPYKWSGVATEHTFVVPLNGLQCGSTVYLQAHASVVKVENGEIVQSETAYAGDITKPQRGAWYGNIAYVIQCCDVEPPPVCYQEETAWAAGTRYENPGNWATYTTYVAGSTVDIFAGQTYLVGTAHFSGVDGSGNVTITITLLNGAQLQAVSEPVKIQGYEYAPSDNPNPGGFDHKGTSLTVIVPVANFYGIHLDVKRVVDCPA